VWCDERMRDLCVVATRNFCSYQHIKIKNKKWKNTHTHTFLLFFFMYNVKPQSFRTLTGGHLSMIYSLLVSAISVVASQSCEQIDKVNGFIGTGGIAYLYCLHVLPCQLIKQQCRFGIWLWRCEPWSWIPGRSVAIGS
jgi:hypothetical protein